MNRQALYYELFIDNGAKCSVRVHEYLLSDPANPHASKLLMTRSCSLFARSTLKVALTVFSSDVVEEDRVLLRKRFELEDMRLDAIGCAANYLNDPTCTLENDPVLGQMIFSMDIEAEDFE